MITHETESIVVPTHSSVERSSSVTLPHHDILAEIDEVLRDGVSLNPTNPIQEPDDQNRFDPLWGAAPGLSQSTTLSPCPEDDREWYYRKDREKLQVVPPKRQISYGGLILTISPAETPVKIIEGPEGVTAEVGLFPQREIIPHLIVGRAEQSEQPPTLCIGGPGRVVVLAREGVSVDADRPGRTRGNTLLHALPGAVVTRPEPNAA